jgi:predicted DNA-binding transcriptional regulator YafY
MNRYDRLDLLARTLRDRPGVTAAELADDFGLSIRTVFRDLEHLRERGLPVESSRGRGGGLRLTANWGLGKVLFSRNEALCTLLSLAVAERLGFPMFEDALPSARGKLADAFPSVERKRLRPLRERILVGRPASADVARSYRQPAPASLRPLQVAFVEEQVVQAIYTREDGTRLLRTFEPHVLFINWPAWYLLAVDRDREAPRTFRVDRFGRVEAQTERFRARPAELAAQVLGPHGIVGGRV